MDQHSDDLKPSASMFDDLDVDPRIRDLRAALNALDNTRSYGEVSLFNKARLEDPSISASEQLKRYAKARAEMGLQSIEEQVADVNTKRDQMRLRRSIEMEGTVDGKSNQGRHLQTREGVTELEHGCEEGETPAAIVERNIFDASSEVEKGYEEPRPTTIGAGQLGETTEEDHDELHTRGDDRAKNAQNGQNDVAQCSGRSEND
ncbi:hypothetical protein N7G274_002119 [Stereocaulon virgatum]|uniref:Uncharacterized protein n=1 Tax=Stereocaulon virgatum TaxID=373712 RepID=A0ABR4AIU0_9LECA